MKIEDKKIKELLDNEVKNRNTSEELSYDKPDPLLVASRYDDEYVILLCALFAYGKASMIVKFLDTLDFSLLNQSEDKIKSELNNHYYRFQNKDDVIAAFIAFRRLKQETSLNDIFYNEYKKEENILEAINTTISKIQEINPYTSQGYKFLTSSAFKRDKQGSIKEIGNSPYKRWNMFLRWMVRDDKLDLGLWKNIKAKDLILPLDTHTFKVSQKLGLLSRKTYDLKAALEITKVLKTFDKNDPIKYDFALYRIGQESML